MIKILRKIHLWIALISATFVMLLCLSGALLLFAPSLDKMLFSQQWQVEPTGRQASVSSMIAVVKKHSNEPVRMISTGAMSDDVWRFKLHSGDYVNLDPYRLTVVKQYAYYQQIYGFTLLFHRWLLWQTDSGEKPLRDWVSIVALSLMVNLMIGFYLWLKPKAPLKRLKIRFRAKRKILFSQLHSVIGVVVFIPLLLMALSGIAFNWQTPTKWLVESITGQKIQATPSVAYVNNNQPDMDINTLVQVGLTALPYASLYRIYLPTDDQPLRLRLKTAQESHAFSWVWVDPKTAQVLGVYDGGKANFATQVWRFKYKFHIGQFISQQLEWLWLLFSLAPLLFLFTGLWLHFKRRR